MLSSYGAKASSWFLYPRTKGEVERDVAKLGYQYLAIHQPGLLLNRDNDARFVEKVFSAIPIGPRIEAADLGLAMLNHAIN